jgi:hypothetical protein
MRSTAAEPLMASTWTRVSDCSNSQTCTGFSKKQQAAEKRRLLDFAVSNLVWREVKTVPAWPQPFDMIALANESAQTKTGGERSKQP